MPVMKAPLSAEPSETEARQAEAPGMDAGTYVDSSALAKVYAPAPAPAPECEMLDAFLRGRRCLMISELAITEVLSAVACRKRERELSAKDAVKVRDAVLADAPSGAFTHLDLRPAVHREAERLLLATDPAPCARSMRYPSHWDLPAPRVTC